LKERNRWLQEQLKLYLVLGSQDCQHSPVAVLSIASEALAGGVTALQFRDKGSRLTDQERRELAEALQLLCRRHGALFLVNDDVSLAVSLKADGVHVGQEDMPLAEVRRLAGPDMIVGVSAGTVEEALAAQAGGADYLGVGAMYATASKADAGEPIGPTGMAQIRDAVGHQLPIVGIGGISSENLMPVLEAGADGIALISAITRADSPKAAAQSLRRTIDETLSRQPKV